MDKIMKNDEIKKLEHNTNYDSRNDRLELLLLSDVLKENKLLLEKGIDISLSEAYQSVVREADMALELPLYSVMDKTVIPPGGTKHDYMSLSIYTWPDPEQEGGLPYIIKDGLVNPEVEDYDNPRMLRMAKAVEVLSIAYYFTEDERYAKKAAQLLRCWFLDPETAMNPNMLYAQYIPGNGGFKIPEAYYPVYVPGNNKNGIYVSFGGVIEGCIFPALLDCVGLLGGSVYWSPEDHYGLCTWFENYMFWLLESQHGKDEAGTHNNHGSWYCNQVAAYAVFTNHLVIAERILREEFPKRVVLQIEPDGSQPAELYRSISFRYTVFGLTSFFNLAILGERIGINLWNFETKDERSIKKAIDWIVPYLKGEREWTYPLRYPMECKMAIPLLTLAAYAYGGKEYTEVIDYIEDYKMDHWFRLIY
jgi:hypothetical protein